MFCVSSVHIGPSKTACIGHSTSSSTRIWPATARTTPRPTLPYSDVLPSMSPEPTPIQPPPCASNSSAPDGTIPSSSSSLATCDSPALEGEGRRACHGGRGGGEGRRARTARRGGVKVSPHERCPGPRLSPHPVSHLAMLADPPPPGEGRT